MRRPAAAFGDTRCLACHASSVRALPNPDMPCLPRLAFPTSRPTLPRLALPAVPRTLHATPVLNRPCMPCLPRQAATVLSTPGHDAPSLACPASPARAASRPALPRHACLACPTVSLLVSRLQPARRHAPPAMPHRSASRVAKPRLPCLDPAQPGPTESHLATPRLPRLTHPGLVSPCRSEPCRALPCLPCPFAPDATQSDAALHACLAMFRPRRRRVAPSLAAPSLRSHAGDRATRSVETLPWMFVSSVVFSRRDPTLRRRRRVQLTDHIFFLKL